MLGEDGIGANPGEVALLGVAPLLRLDLRLVELAGEDIYNQYKRKIKFRLR